MAEAAARGYSGEEYFALVDKGILEPDDRVELLEGVIVAMSPQNPRHASATMRVGTALGDAIRSRALLRVQLPLITGAHSVPEPDFAIVGGKQTDYDRKHPTTALLVVEIADSSLAQDRLTKAAIYAAAGIPEYWIVNLRDDCVEVSRRPDSASRLYAERRIATRQDSLSISALPDVELRVDDLIPTRG